MRARRASTFRPSPRSYVRTVGPRAKSEDGAASRAQRLPGFSCLLSCGHVACQAAAWSAGQVPARGREASGGSTHGSNVAHIIQLHPADNDQARGEAPSRGSGAPRGQKDEAFYRAWERRVGMKAKDVMTREVVSIDKDERLPAVLELMRKRGISKLPVTEKGRLVGLLVDGDIADELGSIKNRGVATGQLHASSAMRRDFVKVDAETPLAEVLYQMLENDLGLVPVTQDDAILGVITGSDLLKRVSSEQPVSTLMTRELHALAPTDRVIHARRLMLDHHVERLPVLDAGRLLGIVGESDVAQGFFEFRETVTLQHQNRQLKEFTVDQIMVRQVVTTTESESARDAAKRMREHDVGCLPVMRGDRIVGIVTRSDLLRTLDGEL